MQKSSTAILVFLLMALGINLALGEEWTLPITVTGEEGGGPSVFTVTIGGGDSQSLLPAPPMPPECMTYVQLYEPDWVGGPYSEMIYVWPPPADSVVWLLDVDPNGSYPQSATSVVAWEPDSLPVSGDYYITEYFSGTVVIPDMRIQDSLAVTGADHQYYNIICTEPTSYATIEVSQDILDFGLIQTGNQADLPLVIYSTGNAALIIQELYTSEVSFYTDFDPSDSLIEAGDSLELTVTFAPQIERIYDETLYILSNAVNADTVQVSLQGDGGAVPDSVQNLIITVEGADAILTWDEVITSVSGYPLTVDCYLIFFEEDLGEVFNFLAYTSETTYTHFGAGQFSPSMFYFVEAYIGEIGLLDELLIQKSPITREELRGFLVRFEKED